MSDDIRRANSQTIVCPLCEAVVRMPAARCWLCRAALPNAVEKSTSVFVAEPAAKPSPIGVRFSLASLMLLVTLTCVLLGFATFAPGLAVPVGVLTLFAWIRTTDLSTMRQQKGLPVSSGQRTLLFLGSVATYLLILALVVATASAALMTAFLAICAPLFGKMPEAGSLALAFGKLLLAPLGVFVLLMLSAKFRRHWLGETDPPEN